jgi:cytochrome c
MGRNSLLTTIAVLILAKGPPRDRPALVPASMMGDRAFVIFAAPEEISRFIESKC